YEPRRVKQAVVGFGGADKRQVRAMIMRLLALEDEPGEDEGDALALAVCHLHNQTTHAVLRPKAI
ncbi:MAG: crossover junction endodeoxyribonuclease RuvC, partial [Lentisphaerae bacterium]|nr:crossover junction endodeoxyribonuclease RuvC [Lentisphaerota bacterium]